MTIRPADPKVQRTEELRESLAFTTAEPTAELMAARTAEPMAARTAERKDQPTAGRQVNPACTMAEPTAAPNLSSGTRDRPIGTTARGSPGNASDKPVVRDPLLRLTGLSRSAFAASHWGTAPLFRRASQRTDDRFTDLLSLAGVDELVSQHGVRTPFVRMSRDGDVLAPARFTRSGGAGAEIPDQVADDKVLAEFAAGATLVLQGLHRMWPPIQDFAGTLSAQLGHPVQVNAYVTPPQNTGFAPHYDVHDVFVLQFAGRKHWRIHEPVLTAPLRDQPWLERKADVAARSAQAPLIDIVLEPGDMLYLPRGYLHAATSLGDISGHLTVGVHPVTRKSLVDQVFAAVGDDVALRTSLPLGVDLADEAEIAGELDATIAALHAAIDRVDRAAVARGIGRYLGASMRPAPLRPLEQFSAAAMLRPNQTVRLRPGLRVRLRDDADHLVIDLPDKQIRLARSTANAVRFATSGLAVTAAELPGLEARAGLTLLSQLLRDGIVVPV